MQSVDFRLKTGARRTRYLPLLFLICNRFRVRLVVNTRNLLYQPEDVRGPSTAAQIEDLGDPTDPIDLTESLHVGPSPLRSNFTPSSNASALNFATKVREDQSASTKESHSMTLALGMEGSSTKHVGGKEQGNWW